MIIEFVNQIYCRVTPKEDLQLIKSCLEYPSERWKQGPFHKVRKTGTAFLCDQRSGKFLAGLYPRISKYCKDNAIVADTQPLLDRLLASNPSLPGISLREDQLSLLQKVDDNKRGLVVAPPGIGKTVLAGSIISRYPKSKALMIVHTRALFYQTIDNFKGWFGEDKVGVVGEEEFDLKQILVVMVQSGSSLFSEPKKPRKASKQRIRKIPKNETEEQRIRREKRWKKRDEETEEKRARRLKKQEEQNEKSRLEAAARRESNKKDFFRFLVDADVIIVDEVHHAGGDSYSSIMERCTAPIRIGLTATPNPEKTKKKQHLIVEGLFGPIIGQLTIQEGMEKGLLAVPKVKLIPVPLNATIGEYKTYKDLYKYGVVLNKARNRLIAREVSERIANGESVLIMITDVVHGQGIMIQEMARDLYDLNIEFVKGSTETETREKIKKELQSKQTRCVITTTIWREGVNIPSLDCVIWASGGKSDIATLQGLGRGLRTTDEKKTFTIVDFLDPYKHLAQHTIQRLRIYIENGCL